MRLLIRLELELQSWLMFVDFWEGFNYASGPGTPHSVSFVEILSSS